MVKNCVTEEEALGSRTINSTEGKANRTPWFRQKLKERAKKRKRPTEHLKTPKTQESFSIYKSICTETKTLVRRTRDDRWKITFMADKNRYGELFEIRGKKEMNSENQVT